jgi:hypothetical protein
VRYHYIRDEWEKGWFKLKDVRSNEQVADMFTKPLNKDLLARNVNRINLIMGE